MEKKIFQIKIEFSRIKTEDLEKIINNIRYFIV